nr:unnamed protein product [Callosobruchus chinensis]
MHSAIERRIRNKDINLPADYVTHCEKARTKPFPYKVQYLEHSFFKDFSVIRHYTSIRPGRKVDDSTVTDLKAIRYNPGGVLEFKLQHTAESWIPLDRRVKKPLNTYNFEDLPRLYVERRKIKKEKFHHLQILKKSLDVDYHAYYDNIPYC